MYDLRPPHLYVLRDVLEDTDMLEVFLRLRKALPAGTPTHVVKEEELPDLAVAENWGARYVHMGMPPPAEDPILYVVVPDGGVGVRCVLGVLSHRCSG